MEKKGKMMRRDGGVKGGKEEEKRGKNQKKIKE